MERVRVRSSEFLCVCVLLAKDQRHAKRAMPIFPPNLDSSEWSGGHRAWLCRNLRLTKISAKLSNTTGHWIDHSLSRGKVKGCDFISKQAIFARAKSKNRKCSPPGGLFCLRFTFGDPDQEVRPHSLTFGVREFHSGHT